MNTQRVISNIQNSRKCKVIYGDRKETRGCLGGEGMARGRNNRIQPGDFWHDGSAHLTVITRPQWDACVQTCQNLLYCTLKYALLIVYQFCLIRLWNIHKNGRQRLVKSEMLKWNKRQENLSTYFNTLLQSRLAFGNCCWVHRTQGFRGSILLCIAIGIPCQSPSLWCSFLVFTADIICRILLTGSEMS